jgi:hypothetical protein
MNPASVRILEHCMWEHLPAHRQVISQPVGMLAQQLAARLDSDDPSIGAEVTAGLRKLLEATDCVVRAGVALERRTYAAHTPEQPS